MMSPWQALATPCNAGVRPCCGRPYAPPRPWARCHRPPAVRVTVESQGWSPGFFPDFYQFFFRSFLNRFVLFVSCFIEIQMLIIGDWNSQIQGACKKTKWGFWLTMVGLGQQKCPDRLEHQDSTIKPEGQSLCFQILFGSLLAVRS